MFIISDNKYQLVECVHRTLLLDVSSIFFDMDLSFVASSLLNSSAGLVPGFLIILWSRAFSWVVELGLKLRRGGGGGGGQS